MKASRIFSSRLTAFICWRKDERAFLFYRNWLCYVQQSAIAGLFRKQLARVSAHENTFNRFARFIPRARGPRLSASKVGIVGFLTNCPATAARGTGRRCCSSRLKVRADALMAAKEKRKGRREERQAEREKERDRSMSFLVCDMLLPEIYRA